jgi:hypothetical protein
MCELAEGFHHAVLWLISDIYPGEVKHDPYFEVKVLAPKTSIATVVAREMMFVKAEDMPRPWRNK